MQEGFQLSPTKKPAGTAGQKTTLEVNYFPLNVDGIISSAFHYDLTFEPPGPKKFLGKALEVFRLKHFRNETFAFDGRKNVYTTRKLNKDVVEDTVGINVENDTKNYKIKIQFTNAVVDLELLKK